MKKIPIVDRYSENELRQIIKESFSMKEFALKLGYSAYSGSLKKVLEPRIEKYELDRSHFLKRTPVKRNIENVFCLNSTADQKTLRRWYKEELKKEEKCSICNQINFWNGLELSLTLDHINGNNKDNRQENLRWVCPNCDRQLDTYGSKNIKKQATN